MENTEAQSTEQGTTQESIPVTEASDEDLKSYPQEHRDDLPEEEAEEAPTVNEVAPPKRKDDSPTVEAKPEAAPAKAVELSKTETPDQKIQRLEKERAQQELFIQRRSTELGEVRKQLREERAKRQALITAEHFQENPIAALDNHAVVKEIDRREQALDQEEQNLRYYHEGITKIRHYVKDEDIDLQAMEQLLREDGLTDETFNFQAFRKNPLSVATPENIIANALRARDRKLVTQYYNLVQHLSKENAELKAKPQEVLGKVSEALKAKPHMTASNGVVAPGDGSFDVINASTEQLREYLKAKR